jgi:hypothetical protein
MNSHFLGEAKTRAVADSATGDRRGHVSLFLFIQNARRYREEYHVESAPAASPIAIAPSTSASGLINRLVRKKLCRHQGGQLGTEH